MVQAIGAAEFAALLAPLGPFGAPPRLGLAVSGGGDSLALAVLAAAWARTEGGSVLALTVDHGLRPGSAAEATDTAETLRALGIPTTILMLDDLAPGASLPARARIARLQALEAACRQAGIIDLLLAHHAADQAETVLMRQLRGSGPHGLAGIPSVSETASVRLLRPLLGVAPERLHAVLTTRGIGWAEDPTNADRRFTRARLRLARADSAGIGPATRALSEAAFADGRARRASERRLSDWLASAVTLRPEGFAVLPEGDWPAAALAALLRMVAGAGYLPPPDAVRAISAAPAQAIGRGVCLAGARLLPAGRLGPGFLVCRERAAMAGPVPALAEAVWDGRFRRPLGAPVWPGETIGALGTDSRRFRRWSGLPAAVLETLPAYRDEAGAIAAVPALIWPDRESAEARQLLFHPRHPVAHAAFVPGPSMASPDGSCRAGKAVMPANAPGHEEGDALHRKTSYL